LKFGPKNTKLGFYQLSTFSIFKNIIRANDTLNFPEFLWYSRNHYRTEWTLNRTLRRLKNVIIVMEVEPSLKDQSFLSMIKLAAHFTGPQEAILLRCFNMFDLDEDGKLTLDDIARVRLFLL
jgi:hypothetical protein